MGDPPDSSASEDQTAADLLVAARPRPDDEFVARTEQRLLGRARRRRVPRVRAGLALSGAVAAVLVVATLAGGGPLSSNDTSHAKPTCVSVRVTRPEIVGVVTRDATGHVRVVHRRQPVTRLVRRCR